jgi:predicted small lipoprotein YifL
MRFVAGLILVLVALSACGNKGTLYLPSPAPNPQHDDKPVPRK